MGYSSNIKLQYVISFMRALLPAYVIERLFWQAQGMTVQMMVLCGVIYSLTVILLDVPGGILADRIGRKPMIFLGYAFAAGEFIFTVFARSFGMFALAMVSAGIGDALYNGSQNALLYDSLLAEQKQDGFEKLLGNVNALDLAGSMIAMLFGGVLAAQLGFSLNYYISFVSMMIAAVLSLGLKEPPLVTKSESEVLGAVKQAKQALVLLRQKPVVLMLCVSGMVLGAALTQMDEFYQLILYGAELPVVFFGIVGAVLVASRIPGNLLAHKLKQRLRYRSVLNAIFVLNIAGYLALFVVRSVWAVIPIAVISFAAGITEPLVLGYLHHETDSSIRATVESFASLGLQILSMLVGLLFGWVSTQWSIFAGFLPLAVICIIWLVCSNFLARRNIA
ncbi:MAG: MFS transporter [Oscillospiraceae bacterium]|nr:MFS transporter [Oscillospiraceae bacterium]